MQKRIRLLLLMGILFCGFARAGVVTDLNVGNVPVPNASQTEREKALPKALGQALVKMSGNPGVMTLPEVQNSMTKLNTLIQSYSYSNRTNQLILQVTFDKKGLNTILQKAGQAAWSADRPTTLVWMNIRNGSDFNVLSNTSDAALSQVLQKDANLRGIPIVLPAMDLQDQSFETTKEDGSFDIAKLQEAAKRYGASAILSGNVAGTADDRWHARWLLLVNGAPYRWETTSDNLSGIVGQAVTDMANLMANQLAVVGDEDLRSDVTLKIQNVSDLGDYSNVLKAIRRLSPVSKVTVKDMSGSELLLQIKTVGGEQALTRALSTQHRFATVQAAQSADNTNAATADLYYRWIGNTSNE